MTAEGNNRQPPVQSERLRIRSSVSLMGLFVLAVAYTLYFAAKLLIPITISVLLSILFFPLVRSLARRGVPRSLSSGLIVAAIVMVVGLAVSTLSEPAQEWLQEAPQTLRELKRDMLHGNENLDDIKALADEVDNLAEVDEEGFDPEAPQPVVVKGPGMFQEFMGNLPVLIGTSMVIVFLTFFMLVNGDALLRATTRCGRTFTERRQIVEIARRFQSELSRYLATISIINGILGLTTALVLYLLDVPNPAMWGTMVGLFNFAPYVGALVSALVLTVVGLMNFPTIGEALLVPGSFVILTTLEGQLITPAIVGRNMSINPMMVLLSVVVWGWLWGIAGALMAVPLLASIQAVCEHYPPLKQVGDFLSNHPAPAATAKKPTRRARRRGQPAA